MTSITLKVTGAQACASVKGPLTSGMVGIPVTITYDGAWDGLTKNLVCRCSLLQSDNREVRTILDVGETAVVAHEVMKAGMLLYLGIEGFSHDGKLVIPTTWAMCGMIRGGANTGTDLSADPTLPIWNQLQTEINQIKGTSLSEEELAEIQAGVQAAIQAANTASIAADGASRAAQSAAVSAGRAESSAARAENAAGSLQNTTKEVVTTISIGAEPVVLDSTAPEQTVNLVWTVDNARTIPAFTNYLIRKASIGYPRAFSATAYTQFFQPNTHGNESAFVAGHSYFFAMHYRMDGDSEAVMQAWGGYITPTGSTTLRGSGWAYGRETPVAASAAYFILTNGGTGTGTIDYVYCIDITAMQEAGTVAEGITLAELVELFGELPLVPGEDYPGGTVGDGTATLSINRGGSVSTVDNTSGTATVKGGDILSVEGGSVTFMLKTYKTVSADEAGAWEGIKWVAFGDSLTDGSINADTKYHKLIAEATGITVVDMGKGGTGYWRRSDEGNAFYQRMANVPADTDIITIFGSVNDWATRHSGVEIGTASDTIEDGTLAGYINECIDVAISTAPYAQLALITPLDYHSIPDDTMEAIANIIADVANRRRIKCVDMYHDSGFRVDDPVFAQAYCTDYSATAETYGHPSNLAHKKIIAPEFMELLNRMILAV